MTAEVDWRDIFIRSLLSSWEAEGVDFLHSYDFTTEEWDAIEFAVAEAEEIQRQQSEAYLKEINAPR